MIAGLSNVDFWLGLMGASETVLPYARDYMTIILFGMFFQTYAMAASGLIRAEGNARVPMIGMILGAVLNIILDAIFIIPMGMGVTGAALATVIAQLISVAYFMGYYFNGKSFLKIHWRNLIPELSILRDIFAIGIAALSMTLAGSISAVFVNRMLGAYGGDLAVSTFGIINRIVMLALGSHAAKLLFLAMYLIGFVMVGSIIFQAIGKAIQSFVTAIARPALFLLPLIFILPHYWQLDGVWLAYPITDALTFLLTFILLIPQISDFRKKDMLARGAVMEARLD
jgi:Na+-driven multidrug efflux pump